MTRYRDAAARLGVDLYRTIDKLTKAKTVFAKSGIPGSVGSAACDLWQGLSARLTEDRAFRLWPFEGDLDLLLRSAPIVVGEIYPRAAYATALSELPLAKRPPVALAKTDARIRAKAVEALQSARWVRTLGISIEDAQRAVANEDDFDACLTAAALLRSVLEGDPLCPATLNHPHAEGGILGTSGIDLRVPEQRFPASNRTRLKRVQINKTDRARSCPVEGCEKVFQGTRGGWDAHAASTRAHPRWHPEITSAEARRRQFETEFPEFFR